MRLLLSAIVFGLCIMFAAAEPPDRNDLEALGERVNAERAMDPLFVFDKMGCFYEHVCTRGPVGLRTDCETVVKSCLNRAWASEIDNSEFYNETCEPVFVDFTPMQIALLREPEFCEVPPPAIAFKPTMAVSELNCFCDDRARLVDDPRAEVACIDNITKCTIGGGMKDYFDRSECRQTREQAVTGAQPILSEEAIGQCRIVMATPVLWETGVPVGSSEDAASVSQKVADLVRAHPELQEESDLDELDF